MTRAAFPAEREPYTGPATGDFDADLARFAYRRERRSPHAPTEVIPRLPPYTGPRTGDVAALPPEMERLRVTTQMRRPDAPGGAGAPSGQHGAGAAVTPALLPRTGPATSDQIALLERQAAEREPPRAGHAARGRGRHRPGATEGGVEPGARVHVIIPAHNEQAGIARTIRSVLAQTRRPDRVIVVPDNCTDATAAIASRFQVEVMPTSGNTDKKAGALNHALSILWSGIADRDFVLCIDADTVLEPRLIERSLAHFNAWRRLGSVSAHHLVTEQRGGLLVRLQQMEMERGRRSTSRKYGRHACMSGMASMFRASALRMVRDELGRVYDGSNWTEDWQLTFALRHLGWQVRKPDDLVLSYTPCTTWKGLFRQRERWGRGYFQTLCYWGLTRHTLRGWALQAWWALTTAVWVMFAFLEVRQHTFRITPWLAVVTVALLSSAVVTVRRAGIRPMLTAAAMVPDMAYSWWINAATLWGIAKHLLRRDGQWGNVREK